MKKTFVLLGIMMLTAMQVLADSPQPYKLKTLTFEDADAKSGFEALTGGNTSLSSSTTNPWSSLIAPIINQEYKYQYGSPMLYGGEGVMYWWYDGGNTGIKSPEVNQNYYSGGHAISHYGSADYMAYGDYTYQFTVYQAGNNAMRTSGCGHNGSNNFCVHFGYIDGWTSSSTGDLPRITFEDGVARVIDHMYVAPTTYTYRAYAAGDAMGLVAPSDPEDQVWIEAYGYKSQQEIDDDEPSVSTNFYLINGADEVVTDWTKWDLSELGEVVAVAFNLDGSDFTKTLGYFVYPAYFAYDDVAVRFDRWKYERTGLTIGNYGTICLPRDVKAGDYEGATFFKVVERNTAGIILEEVTSLTAGQAYIFQATDNTLTAYSDDEENKVTEPAPATNANVLQGVFEETHPSTGWILNNNELYKCDGILGRTVPANRAYLTELIPAFSEPVPGRRRVQIPIQQAPTELQNVEAQDAQAQKVMQNGVLYINKNGYMYDVKGQIVK